MNIFMCFFLSTFSFCAFWPIFLCFLLFLCITKIGFVVVNFLSFLTKMNKNWIKKRDFSWFSNWSNVYFVMFDECLLFFPHNFSIFFFVSFQLKMHYAWWTELKVANSSWNDDLYSEFILADGCEALECGTIIIVTSRDLWMP